MKKTAIIVGAGIGGLSAAITLSMRGWAVQVFEQSPQVRAFGAGLQLSPNAVKILDGMGVLPHLTPHVFEPLAIDMRMGLSGRRVFALPLKDISIARWGAAYFHVHRADLINALLKRADAFPDLKIITDLQICGVKAGALMFSDGKSFSADLIVGADGIRSTVAQSLGLANAPRFVGAVAWRATVDIDKLDTPPPPTACAWVGAGKHCVTTLINGGKTANFVGIVEQDAQVPENWRNQGDRAQVAADFAGWAEPIQNIINCADILHCWSLYERQPLAQWSKGNVVLLGDAAHAMAPSMAQGAAQAIEDAWILAQQMEAEDGTERYEAIRKPRTSKVQQLSLANLKLFHRRNRLTQLMTYGPAAVASWISPSLLHRRYDWIYGYDARPLGTPEKP